MGHRLNRLNEPVFIAVSKPLLTEFGIHHILESCAPSHTIVSANRRSKRVKGEVGENPWSKVI